MLGLTGWADSPITTIIMALSALIALALHLPSQYVLVKKKGKRRKRLQGMQLYMC